jgi:hypothetical protein
MFRGQNATSTSEADVDDPTLPYLLWTRKNGEKRRGIIPHPILFGGVVGGVGEGLD